MKHQHQRGLTAIELMVVVVISAILLTIAVPSFNDLINRRRVEGLANELSADLQYAHSESISHNADIEVTLTSGGYKIYRLTPGTGAKIEPPIKTVTELPKATSLSLGTDAVSFVFTALRGMAFDDPKKTVKITISSTAVTNNSLTVVVNSMGRTEICAPNAAWGGYAKC
jgi:type IV fimbrial biogenesis protein FimT